ncbi:MAG: hypothetical protein HY427_03670 [Candidatus Levybacteria bacterium]|nr:hypothetical protein [Candidatus Levybacteria bacterium]
MAETLCTSGMVKHRANYGASSTVTNSGTWMTELINQAEGQVIADTRVNWIDIYSTLNADFKQVLEQATACWAANAVIAYDTRGFLGVNEAATMINVNWAQYQQAIKTLKEDKTITFFGATLGA